MMRVVYLHGLESNGISDEKRKSLKSIGINVYCRLTDYNQGSAYNDLLNYILDVNPDFIIGSSMGGRLGYYLSNHLRIPALLFNPALDTALGNAYQPIDDKIKNIKNFNRQLFVFGKDDTVVDPRNTLKFLPSGVNYTFADMAHRIPTNQLYYYTKLFMDFIGK